jgi:acetoin utilization deacetylase AcuC-like enzyme
MAVSREGFGDLASSLLGMADRSAGGRIALVLEGGYNLATLAEGVAEILIRLSESSRRDVPEARPSAPIRAEMELCLKVFGQTWKFSQPD